MIKMIQKYGHIKKEGDINGDKYHISYFDNHLLCLCVVLQGETYEAKD